MTPYDRLLLNRLPYYPLRAMWHGGTYEEFDCFVDRIKSQCEFLNFSDKDTQYCIDKFLSDSLISDEFIKYKLHMKDNYSGIQLIINSIEVL